jgi:hypothetical protein
MAKRNKIGLLGLSNTTLLLIGGGVALYYLANKNKADNTSMGKISGIDDKKVYVVWTKNDGLLTVCTNVKKAYEYCLIYLDGIAKLQYSYNDVTKKFKQYRAVEIGTDDYYNSFVIYEVYLNNLY